MILPGKKVLIVWTLLILQLHAVILLPNSSNSQNNISNVHRKLTEILKSCFPRPRLTTFVISSDLSHAVDDIVKEDTEVSVLTLNRKFNPDQSHRNFLRWPIFLLKAKTNGTLMTLLSKLKSSSFWKSDSTFFIVDDTRGCNQSSRMLQTAWKMNLLASFYICKQSDTKVRLYTFNPFTKRAPSPWREVETAPDGRWTLYRRLCSEGARLCRNIEFDKAKSIDGYEINAVATIPTTHKFPKSHDFNDATDALIGSIGHHDIRTFLNFLKTVKGKAMVEYDRIAVGLRNGKPTGYVSKLLNGTSDIAIDSHTASVDLVSCSCPYSVYSISILTNHKKFLTPVEKISNFYSIGVICFSAGVFLLTWMLFLIRMNGDRGAAGLEVLRMALSTGLLQPLQTISIRIYLFGTLWLVLIVNATFQGNISAFLTKPERRDVENIHDLKTGKYQIYIIPFYYDRLSHYFVGFPDNCIHTIHDYDCYEYVLNNSKAACIQHIEGMIYPSFKYNLHISRKPIARDMLGFWYRHDWPLAKKFNSFTSRMMQSGLTHYWRYLDILFRIKKLIAREEEETAPVIRKIALADISFAFVILAVGLAIASLFFIIELNRNADKDHYELKTVKLSRRRRVQRPIKVQVSQV